MIIVLPDHERLGPRLHNVAGQQMMRNPFETPYLHLAYMVWETMGSMGR